MKTPHSAKRTFEAWAPPGVFRRDIEPRAIRKAQSEVDRILAAASLGGLNSYDLDDLYKRVVRIMRRNDSILDSLKLRDLRRVPWVLFYSPQGQYDSQWIGCSSDILEEYGNWILEKRRTSGPVHALMHEFMREYPRGIETFHGWRKLIRQALEYQQAPSLEKWKTACSRHSLLESRAPEQFVSGLILGNDLVAPILVSANLDQELLRTCNFLRVGINAFLGRDMAQSRDPKLSETAGQRLLEFLILDNKLRFNDREMRVKTAHALLDQYRHSNPSDSYLNRLRDWFVQHFGNPHLPPHRRRGWVGVPDPIRLVIGRWLVDLHIDGFIDLIKETAMDRHWRFREAFWRSLSQRYFIQEISFALGGHANALFAARSTFRTMEDSVAKLRGAEPSQSVLLMRLRGLTIAEWSHNGSCRIWLDGHPNTPRLFEKRYDARSLRSAADFVQPHLGSDGYSWQARIAEWLRENNGPDIRPEDYRIGNPREAWSRE